MSQSLETEQNTENAHATAKRQVDYLAYALMALGALAAYESLVAFLKAAVPSINFLVVFIFIGLGLRQRREVARKWSLRCVGFVLAYYLGSALFRIVNGVEMGAADLVLYVIITVLATISSGWAFVTLSRPSVVELFEAHEAKYHDG